MARGKRFVILVLVPLIVIAVMVIKRQAPKKYQLDFRRVEMEKTESMTAGPENIFFEKSPGENCKVFLFTRPDREGVFGGIYLDGEHRTVGLVSMEETQGSLAGIEEVRVFGKKAMKFYGALGASYPHTVYWFMDIGLEDSILRVDGHTVERDLDDDGKEEVISSLGTVPETSIYTLGDGEILVSSLNGSLGAKSVTLKDGTDNIFQVYFKPNKPERYQYLQGSLVRK